LRASFTASAEVTFCALGPPPLVAAHRCRAFGPEVGRVVVVVGQKAPNEHVVVVVVGGRVVVVEPVVVVDPVVVVVEPVVVVDPVVVVVEPVVVVVVEPPGKGKGNPKPDPGATANSATSAKAPTRTAIVAMLNEPRVRGPASAGNDVPSSASAVE
jgi:hypothetical protein